MFTRETVLVLGAGSNMPYGYPSGSDLISWLLDAKREPGELPAFRRDAGFGDGMLEDFRNTLASAHATSIDQFLEWHHPKHSELGKYLIAQQLLRVEDHKGLLKLNVDCWYHLLLNEIAPNLAAISQNRLTVVTFNYDRSLEHYLFTTVKHRFNLSDGKTAEALQNINFIHVHGQLGLLPWQAKNGASTNAYGASLTRERLIEAASGIKIIFEAGANEEFPRARKAIETADYIFFLGFGYHEENMQRLGMPLAKAKSDGTGNRIMNGTAPGCRSNRLSRLRSLYPTIAFHNAKVSALIEDVEAYALATAPIAKSSPRPMSIASGS